MKKIGILTWHYYANFGSALQAYALQKTVERMGHQTLIVNYQNPRLADKPMKEWLCSMVGSVFQMIPHEKARRFSYPFQVFRAKYMRQTRRIETGDRLTELVRDFDGIVCGSDQIWAPNVFNSIYLLEPITEKRIKKVSYAASVGLNHIPEQLQPRYRDLLNDFHAVAVREESGKRLLAELCDIHATVVLDPTLLLEADHYRTLQNKVHGLPEKYVFCYFLNKEHQYRTRVEEYAREHGLEVVGVSENSDDSGWMKGLKNIGPQEFLWMIDHSHAVFTDSYHGTIFSLLMHKEFFTFERFSSSDPICQNSRIYQLDRWFGIGGRILGARDVPEQCPALCYEHIEARLQEAREISRQYLSGALM